MNRIIDAIKQAHKDYQTLKGGTNSGNFGHAGRPGKHGGSAGGVGLGGSSSAASNTSGSVNAAKNKITERAGKLGYGKVTFEKTKNGLQVVAGGPKGGKPKKLNLYINDEGKIVNKDGKESLAYKD